MTFGNPLTGADGTMVRDRIRSANYAAGVAGWQLTREGLSQVDSLQVLGTLGAGSVSAGALTLAGADLAGALGDMPAGLLARGWSQTGTDSAPTSGTTELSVFRAKCGPVRGGRAYAFTVTVTPWLVSGTAPAPVDVSLRYTTDGGIPDETSTRLAVWRVFLPVAGMGPSVTLYTKHEPVADVANLRICLTVRNMTAGNVVSVYGTRPTSYVLEDLGLNPYNGALTQVSVASGTPGTEPGVRYVTDYPAVWTASYAGNGAGLAGTDAAQGWTLKTGQRTALIGFDSSTIRSDTFGASVVSAAVTWKVAGTVSPVGLVAVVGTSGATGAPVSWPAGVNAGRVTAPAAAAGELTTVDLGAGIGADFSTGAAAALSLGPAPSTGASYAGTIYGAGADVVPTLRLTYDK